MYEKFIKSTNQVFFVVQCFLSYRVTFLCNGFAKLIIHQKALYDIFYEKTCKVVYLFIRISIIGRSHIFIFFKYPDIVWLLLSFLYASELNKMYRLPFLIKHKCNGDSNLHYQQYHQEKYLFHNCL